MPQQNKGFHQLVPRKLIHTPTPPQANIQTEQQIENNILSLVDSILPSAMRPVNDKYTGVDYNFAGIKIDRKFGFYYGGKDSIRVRLNKEELINKSDYTMVMHPDRIDFFPTQKIRDYLKKHPKSAEKDVEQTPRKDKRTGKVLFVSARIKLSDLYLKEGVKPLSVAIPLEQLVKNRSNLKLRELARLQEMVEKVLRKVQVQNVIEKPKTNANRREFFKKFASQKKMLTTTKKAPKISLIKTPLFRRR